MAKKMAPTHVRARTVTEDKRQLMMEHYLRGDTQYTIGKRFGISQPRVHQLLNEIRQEWKANTLMNQTNWVVEEVEKVRRVEQAAHLAYVKSCLPNIKLENPPAKMSEKNKREWVEERKRERSDTLNRLKALPLHELLESNESRGGDLRLLETILKCIDRRAKLLGLDAPEKINVETTGTTQTVTMNEWKTMPVEDRLKYIQDRLAANANN